MNKEEAIKFAGLMEEYVIGRRKELENKVNYKSYRDIVNMYLQLQQENKQLKEELYEAQRQNNELEQDGQDMAKELSIRIDKALEYIENHLYMESDYGIQHPTLDGKMNYETNGFELLEILKGDSNE